MPSSSSTDRRPTDRPTDRPTAAAAVAVAVAVTPSLHGGRLLAARGVDPLLQLELALQRGAHVLLAVQRLEERQELRAEDRERIFFKRERGEGRGGEKEAVVARQSIAAHATRATRATRTLSSSVSAGSSNQLSMGTPFATWQPHE